MKWLVLAVGGGLAAATLFAVHTSSPTQAGNFKITPSTATRTLTPLPTRTPIAPTPVPAPAAPASLAALGPGVMLSECRSATRDSVRTTFLWTPSDAGAQYLDLSVDNNGFAPGTFVGAGAFGPQQYGYIWDGLRQGRTHFARVNTYTAAGWKESSTLSFYTPVCDAAASAPPDPGADLLELREEIAEAINEGTIDTAVAITDLRTGETIDVAGSAQRLPGCTINLFALMRVIVDLQNYRYPEPEPGDLIGQTITRSDPVTARHLVRDWLGGGGLFAGIGRVNDFMHALGMSNAQMDHPPAFPEESLAGSGNRITALDVNRGLQALWDGHVLAPFWRDYLLSKMTLVKPGLNYLIPIGVSAGATVSHKNGFLYEEGWADNDIGIVWYERGGERYGYAISFFTQNVPGKYDDIPLGQQISSLAYQWFAGRYGYA